MSQERPWWCRLPADRVCEDMTYGMVDDSYCRWCEWCDMDDEPKDASQIRVVPTPTGYVGAGHVLNSNNKAKQVSNSSSFSLLWNDLLDRLAFAVCRWTYQSYRCRGNDFYYLITKEHGALAWLCRLLWRWRLYRIWVG